MSISFSLAGIRPLLILGCVMLIAPLSVDAQVTVWTPPVSTMLQDDTPPTPGDPAVQLLAPRNGLASALIAARDASGPIRNGQVRLSALQQTGGSARIAPDAFTIRYGSSHHRDKIGMEREAHSRGGDREPQYFHFSVAPMPEVRTFIAMLTVQVPADQAPGTYTGNATLSTGQSIPVTLEVSEYVNPNPEDYISHRNFISSPDSIALRYGVTTWSREFWPYYQQSLKLYRQMAQNVMHVCVIHGTAPNEGGNIRRGHFGSRISPIRFRQQGNTFVPDFALLDQMIAQWKAHVFEPDFVVLVVWDQAFRKDFRENMETARAVVTGMDGEPIQIPYPGTPGSESIWKATVEGARARVKAAGWNPDNVILGITHDAKPGEELAAFWNKTAPDFYWNVISHARGYKSDAEKGLETGGLKYRYQEYPWNTTPPENLGDGLLLGWNYDFLVTTLARFHGTDNPLSARWLMEGTVGRHVRQNYQQRGVSRYKLEFFPIPTTDNRGRVRYGDLMEMGGMVNLMRNHTNLLTAGPTGAEPSILFQNFVEGIQELEARIAIEKVFIDRDLKAKLPKELVEAGHQVLRERSSFVTANRKAKPQWTLNDELDWFDHTRRLYATAAALQKLSE